MEDGSYLLSLSAPLTIAGLGRIDDSDILRFVPTSLGANTAGTLALYFDGSDVGLEANEEDINAIVVTDEGILLSTVGAARVPGAGASPADLLLFRPSQLGSETAGTWSRHLHGMGLGLGDPGEKLLATTLWATGELYFVASHNATLDDLAVADNDIVHCLLAGVGQDSACHAGPRIIWSGAQNGLSGHTIDGLMVLGE